MMTFSSWLKDQRDRGGVFGELARAVEWAGGAPRGRAGLHAWHHYLHRRSATVSAVDALHAAWREFRYDFDPRYDRIHNRQGWD